MRKRTINRARQRPASAAYRVGTIQNKGYSNAGASKTKRALKGMTATSGSPHEDINENNYTLRQRSRALSMGATICASAIKTNRTNVIGIGLRLKSAIDRETLGMSLDTAKEWQRRTEAEFRLWATKKNTCDATGINDFYGIQQLCLMSALASGDVFVLMKRRAVTPLSPYGLRLHVIEADRCRTPSANAVSYALSTTKGKAKNGNIIYDGVEVDSEGMITAYYIANNYPYERTTEPTDFVRIEAYGKETGLPNILQIMESERPEQYRGVPYLAQVIEPMLQIKRYTEAEITAAVIQSFMTAFVTTEAGADDFPFNEAGEDYVEEVSKDPNDYEMGPGTINVMEPGEDIKFNTPTHPATAFDKFVRALCVQIGAALEIPADLLLKEFNASYSASRAALLEAWKAFKMRRTWIANSLCKPVYEIWLTEAVASGRISAPGFLTDPILRQAYLESEWIGPSQGMLDPTKEIQAAVDAIENGLSTHEQEAIKLNGSEFDTNIDKLQIENEKIKNANSIKQGTGGME